MAAYTQGKPLNTIPITGAMPTRVIAVRSDDLIEQAEELMRENQIRRLPVLDGEGRLVGLVSMNDLARLAARAKKSAVDRELVKTLAAICQPRGRSVVPSEQAGIGRPALAS
jgi:CBS domain-containing protein